MTISDALCVDSTIGHAVRIHYLAANPEHEASYDQHKVVAWRTFYESSPRQTSEAFVKALKHLLSPGDETQRPAHSHTPPESEPEASAASRPHSKS